MIQSLSLRHFQSHKKTDLQFTPGVNSIIGSSNSGKTAILRALYWAVYNRPSGLSFISHWNRDNKDKPIKSTLVRVTNDNGIIERRKGKLKGEEKEFNGYIVNENVLEAIGQDVPDEVSKLFNLDSVNIQKQMDAPFLLSESAGEVARFFNSTIRLDLIDRILSKAESKRRDANKEKTHLESEQSSIDKEIETFNWIDEAEQLANRIVKIEDRQEDRSNRKDSLEESVNDYLEYKAIIEKQEVLLSAVPIIDKITRISESQNAVIEKYNYLRTCVEDWREQKKIIEGTADFSSIEKMISNIDEFRKELYEKVQLKEKIEESIVEYKERQEDVNGYADVINELENQLPSTCVLCGAKLVKESHIHDT